MHFKCLAVSYTEEVSKLLATCLVSQSDRNRRLKAASPIWLPPRINTAEALALLEKHTADPKQCSRWTVINARVLF